MGQKVHPIGFRLGITKGWEANWFNGTDFKDNLLEDKKIREFIYKRFPKAGISRILIERTMKTLEISVYSSRPGVIIGTKGAEVENLKSELRKMTDKEVQVFVEEVKMAFLDARIVAQEIARQLEARMSFRRVMKKALAEAMKAGAKGIKIKCSGRLGGVEMARSEEYRDGRVPLSTLRADIDYALVPAYTIYGVIGVKVWIFKGERYGKVDIFEDFLSQGKRRQDRRGRRGGGRGGRRNRNRRNR